MTAHDGSYKHIFSHAQIVEDLLRGFVHEDWVAQIDYGSLELVLSVVEGKVGGSYVTDDLREREDGIIWRVRFKPALSGVEGGEWLYVYLLIEFQSRSDPWMALRILSIYGVAVSRPGKKRPDRGAEQAAPDLPRRGLQRRKPLAGRLRSG